MTMYASLIVSSYVLCFITAAYGATFERASGAPTGIWKSVAMSYTTGQFVTASQQYGHLYLSSDFGQSWKVSTVPRSSWNQVGVSSDGQYQVACGSEAPIYLSSDYGENWSATGFTGNWTGIAISGDGQYVVAGHYASHIYYSSDFGQTFTQSATSGQRAWISVHMAGISGYVTALAVTSGIFHSTDFGQTWSAKSVGTGWTDGFIAVGSEAAGGAAAAVTKAEPFTGVFLKSSWTPSFVRIDAPSGVSWNGITCDVGGDRSIAVGDGGSIYGIKRTGGGYNYASGHFTVLTAVSRAWVSPTMSWDYKHVVVADSDNGYLYYSSDSFMEGVLPEFNGVHEEKKPAQIPAYVIAIIVVASVIFVAAVCTCVLYRQRICKGRCGAAQADSDLPVTSSVPTPSSDAPQPNTTAPTRPAAAAATPPRSSGDGGGAGYQSSTVQMVPLPRLAHSAYSDTSKIEGPSAPPSHNGGYAPVPTAIPTVAAVYPYSYSASQDVVVVVAEAYVV
jgi:hypothetical protein